MNLENLTLDTIAAILLLAGLVMVSALIAWAWLKIIVRAAQETPLRGRAAIRARTPIADDGMRVKRGPGWSVVSEEPGCWPRQWPIPETRRFLPGDEWSSEYDLDGAIGMRVAKKTMTAEGEEVASFDPVE